MKKSLLGLIVALVAFGVGVLAAGIVRIKQEILLPLPAVEEIKIEEVRNEEIPFFSVGQLDEQRNDEVIEERQSEGIYGWYALSDHGAKMREVNMILLSGDYLDENGEPTGKINLISGIYTELGKNIDEGFAESEWTSFDGRTVKFRTKKLKGISYGFEGSFFKNKTSGESGEKVLRGTLRKYVKGKKVAETSGDFAYYEPHCLH